MLLHDRDDRILDLVVVPVDVGLIEERNKISIDLRIDVGLGGEVS